jgi:two-component system chemotaxis sensor kinase CheA
MGDLHQPPGFKAVTSGTRPFISLGVRVTVPVVLLVVSVAFGVYFGLVSQSRARLLNSKEAAADMVVKLTSASVMPAVVFGDPQEMQRAITNLARNPDVSDAELWGFQDSAMGGTEGLLAEFHRRAGVALGRPGKGQRGLFRDADSIRVLEPVVNLEGQTVAGLVVRFSTARETATLAQLSRQILYVSGATALCLAAAILLAIHRVVVRPVARLEEAAGRLARGDQHALESERSEARARVQDEVVRLAEKFGEMAEAVRDREHRLGVRNRDLKLILDSVEQGFLTTGLDGTLFAERSAIVGTWVGALPAGAKLWTLVGRIDPSAGEWLEGAWDQVSDKILPLEVAIAQLPKRISGKEQHFSLNYHPVMVDGELERIVVVITDITAELSRQRVLAEQQEFAALVDQFVRDRRAFHSFWEEASALVDKIVAPGAESEILRRNVHTLKGNTRFFGLSRVSALCHDLESAMSERGDYELTERERSSLTELWESLRARIEPLMRGATVFLEVSREQYEQLVEAVQHREPIEKLEQMVHDLRCEPIATRLEHAKRVLEVGAKQLGKTPPRVELKHNDLRVPAAPWAPFWSVFSHVLNNALDHGLESDEQRRAGGKPVPGSVGLSIGTTGSEIIVEVRDDGSGIDWERVREQAAARKMPHQTRADLERALFTDRFTTRDRVSQVSGRGVGLTAVQHVVTAMGGRIELESTAGAGTTWRFRFPQAALTHFHSVRPSRPPGRPTADVGGGAAAPAESL